MGTGGGGGHLEKPNPHQPNINDSDNPNPTPENKSDPAAVEATIQRGVQEAAKSILNPEADSDKSLLGS